MSIVLLTDEYNSDDDPIEQKIAVTNLFKKELQRKGCSEEWLNNNFEVEFI